MGMPQLVVAVVLVEGRPPRRPAWIHEYNHHRPHTAIGKATPITRLTNLPGQFI